MPKWMITQSMRSAIIRQLLDMAGVKKTIDSPQDLSNHGTTRDNSDLNKIMQGIHSTLNSFENQDNNLYCLFTRKTASDNVKKSFYAVERLEKICVSSSEMNALIIQ